MAKQPHQPAPAPLSRPAPRTGPILGVQRVPSPAPAAPAAGAIPPAAPAAAETAAQTRSTPYGGAVRMAFVFMSGDVYRAIESAAELDEEKVGTWMARVLEEAATARVDYTPPDDPADVGDQNAADVAP